ncbi:hypothetical protein NA57DRAFT_80979 [Rhizodiscina lignyota]|uniref:Uncharacterized protein n=1 Tax=Rhizodiscina lignyota TaxID=1504668 RepID=A0A9P4I521_9PEZI|nr:hypothetical protein NA57DRAFT_80979 [Rhizodiscina lignyota]
MATDTVPQTGIPQTGVSRVYAGIGPLYRIANTSENNNMQDQVHAFCTAMQSVPVIDDGAYADKLIQAVKNSTPVTAISKYFNDVQDVGQTDNKFDGIDCGSTINDLAVASTAYALSGVTDYNFNNGIDGPGALDMLKRCITTLMPAMYGDHINQQLAKLGQSDLRALSSSPSSDFINAYQSELENPTFAHLVKIYDDAHNGGNYALNLLFANAYLHYGPGFTMSSNVDLVVSEVTHWTDIINNWVEQMHEDQQSLQAARPNALPQEFVPHISSVCGLNGYPDAQATDLVTAVSQQIHPELDEWKLGQEIQYYQTLGQKIMGGWEGKNQSFVNVASTSVQANWPSSVPPFDEADNPGTSVIKTMYHYGDDAMAFVNANRSYSFLANEQSGDRTNVVTQNVGIFGSCFKPGTKVLTIGGEVNIEDLYENLEILTRGGDVPQIGICSDEKVMVSTASSTGSPTHLFGFNDESPFFTAGHVFHTTTGLRAISPHIARMENPWVQVGELRKGHTLLRTTNGKTYEQITIRAFTVSQADCDHVYGVHLREGMRSYHANGFLVHLNYPEITLKSISRTLLTIPSKERMGMLSCVHNLKPLFERFGIEAISDLVNRELAHLSTLPPAALKTRPQISKTGGLQHVTRSWALRDTRSKRADGFKGDLPELDVYQGVVYVESKYCPNAQIKENTIIWSRDVANGTWEHGFVKFERDLLLGHGAVTYGTEDASPNVRHIANVRRFIAEPRARRPPKPLKQKAQSFASIKAATNSKERAAHVASAIEQLDKPATTSGNGHAKPVVKVTEPQQPSSSDPQRAATSPSDDDNDDSTASFTLMDPYNLSYDTSDWVDGQATAKTPAAYLQIYTANENTSQHFTCRIPDLDTLRDKVCEKLQSDQSIKLETVPNLYDCFNLVNDDQTASFYFTMKYASIIASAADNYDDKNPKYSNLTFKNLGLDLQLPFIFSSMRLTLNWDGSAMSGIIREFDPTMLDDDGKRHFVQGSVADEDVPAEVVRAFVSKNTVGNQPEAPLALKNSAHLPPKAPAVAMVETAANSLPDNYSDGAKELSTLPLDNSQLSQDSNFLLYLAAKFQMKVDDLKTFTDGVRPIEGMTKGQLPAELASNLPGNLATWLQEEYIPAFISTKIISLDPSVKAAWRINFSDIETGKVTHWFNGKGKGCLSQVPEYTQLNELMSTYATLQEFPRIQDYLSDTEPDPVTKKVGGEKWAEALYNSQGRSFALAAMANTTNVSGTSRMQVICNVLNTLSPIYAKSIQTSQTATGENKAVTPTNLLPNDDKPYALRIVEALKAYKASGFHARYIGLQDDTNSELEYQFLNDSVQSLWTELLSTAPGTLGGDLANSLQQDAQDLVTEMGVDENESAANKAATMAAIASNLIRGIAEASKVIGPAVKGLAKSFQAVQTALDKLEPKMAKIGKIMGPCMVVLTAAMFVYAAVGAYRDWSNLTPTERAVLILSTIQTTLQTFQDGAEALKPAWKWLFPDKAPDVSIAQRDASCASAEENTQTRLPEVSQNSRNIGLLTDEELNDNASALPGGIADDEAMANQVGDDMVGAVDGAVKDGVEVAIGEASVEVAGSITSKLSTMFAYSTQAVKGLLVVVGVAVTIASAISLAQNWSDMDTIERRLNIANVAVMGIAAVAPILSAAIEAGCVAAGIAITEGTVAAGLIAACSWAGPLMLIAGVVIAFLMMFHQSSPDPPPSAPEQWIQDVGQGYTDGLTPPPTSQLTWTLGPLQEQATVQTLTVTGKNTSSDKITLADIEIKFPAGGSPGMLYSEMTFAATSSGTAATTPGQVSVSNTTAETPDVQLATTSEVVGSVAGTAAITWLAKLVGPQPPNVDNDPNKEQPRDLLVFNPGEQIQLSIVGTVEVRVQGHDGPSITLHEDWVDDKNNPWDQWENVVPVWAPTTS